MAIIGFMLLAIIGAAMTFAAVMIAYVSTGFSGRVEWPPVIVLGGIGGAMLYYCWTHAPFAFVMV